MIVVFFAFPPLPMRLLKDCYMSSNDRYPGSKQLRRAVANPAAPVATDPTAWDYQPVLKMLRGKQIELFTVGQLGMALGRAAVTMRVWERKGVLPEARMRLPNKNGIGEFGRRYYTRPQVEAVLAAATQHGLMDRDPTKAAPPLTPEFTSDVLDAWSALESQD